MATTTAAVYDFDAQVSKVVVHDVSRAKHTFFETLNVLRVFGLDACCS